jgi:hypothetical protein
MFNFDNFFIVTPQAKIRRRHAAHRYGNNEQCSPAAARWSQRLILNQTLGKNSSRTILPFFTV